MKHFFRYFAVTVLFISGFLGISPQVCMAEFVIEEDFTNLGQPYKVVYEVDGIKYRLLTYDEVPMKVELIGVSDKFQPTPELILPEELMLPEELIKRIINMDFWGLQGSTPAKIVKIGHGAFKKCQKIGAVKIPSTVRTIGDSAFYMSTLSSIELPEGVVSIGEFALTSQLRNIKIPESIRYLGFGCLFGKGLDFVELPSTFQRFEGRTFFWSPVKDMYLHSEIPPVTDGTDFAIMGDKYIDDLWDCCMGPEPGYCTLHVPAKAMELYKSTFPYRYYDIVAIEEEEPGNDDDPSQSGVEETDLDSAPYFIQNGELTVSCRAGDTLSLYDANGLLLDKRTFSSESRYTHRGNGIRLLQLNGTTHKIAL